MAIGAVELSGIPRPARALVVGASGGIGRALSTKLEEAGLDVCRASRDGAHGPRIDLADEASISAAFDELREGAPLRLVIVASGLLHDGDLQPEKRLAVLNPAEMARAFAVNSIGPILVAKYALPLMSREGRSALAMLSARVGSISDNMLGGWYSYRASKAALNQLLRTLAVEAARTHPELIVASLHPGTVETRLSAPFRKGHAVVSPEEAAINLLRVINRLKAADSGNFFAWDGSKIAF